METVLGIFTIDSICIFHQILDSTYRWISFIIKRLKYLPCLTSFASYYSVEACKGNFLSFSLQQQMDGTIIFFLSISKFHPIYCCKDTIESMLVVEVNRCLYIIVGYTEILESTTDS